MSYHVKIALVCCSKFLPNARLLLACKILVLLTYATTAVQKNYDEMKRNANLLHSKG